MKKFGAFLVLWVYLGLSSVWALPPVSLEYAKDYAKLRKELQFSEIKILRDGYKNKNAFLREWMQPQPTEIEIYITDKESGYGFFSPESSREELEKLIVETQNSKTIKPSKKELILGDAYHWLGHVYEERGEFIKAYELYIRSHVHYQKTPLKRSPRINPELIVQEHGVFHLKKIKEAVQAFATMPGFKAQICASLFN